MSSKKPLSDKELYEEIEKIFHENTESQESEYSRRENEDFIDFDESESEYVRSDDSFHEPYFELSTSKKRRKIFSQVLINEDNEGTKTVPSDICPTDIQQKDDSVEQNVPVSTHKASLKGRDGHRLTTMARKVVGRTSKRNIIHIMPGPKDLEKTTYSPLDTFSPFITDAMVDIIVAYTNAEINVRCGKYKDPLKATVSNTSAIEIKSLIGLFYCSAATIRQSSANF
ncbi:hypothetical protein QE152_g15445 [Popillia japonica]|uniref:PiggyBac transposable element-derived protein domain-containing protein n=1 Tax=Popillia japonica TaxID=7064 RepID=A0AAW1L943_POPJA